MLLTETATQRKKRLFAVSQCTQCARDNETEVDRAKRL